MNTLSESNTNSIIIDQNSQKYLDFLAAFSHLYRKSVNFQTSQLILIVIIYIGGILSNWYPTFQTPVLFFSLLVTIINQYYFENLKKNTRGKAAKIQEEFDCGLFKIPWNDTKVGSHPETEEIIEAKDKFRKKFGTPSNHYNWYTNVGNLPIEYDRILCQRMNVFWDCHLRDKYTMAIWILLAVLFVILLICGLITGMSMEKWLYSVIAPILPTSLFVWTHYMENKECIQNQMHYKTVIDTLLEAMISGTSSDFLTSESRTLQNEIFDYRSRNPKIYDWVYRIFRIKQEHIAECSYKEYVEKIKKHLENKNKNNQLSP